MNNRDLDGWDPMTDDYRKDRNRLHNLFGSQGLKPSNCLFIRNIPLAFDQGILNSMFSRYGNLERVHIKKTGGITNYGFVTYSNLSDATNAIANLQDNPQGLEIVYARPKGDSEPSSYPPASLNRLRNSSSDISSVNSDQTEEMDGSILHNRLPHAAKLKVQVGSANLGRRVTCEQRWETESISSVLPPGFNDSEMPCLKPISDICTRCGNEGTFSCSRCLMPYCSAACQRTDWPRHSDICKPTAYRQPQRNKDTSIDHEAQSGGSATNRSRSTARDKDEERSKRHNSRRRSKSQSSKNSDVNNTQSASGHQCIQKESSPEKELDNHEKERISALKSRISHPHKRIDVPEKTSGALKNGTNSSSSEKISDVPGKPKIKCKQDGLEQRKIKISSLGSVALSGDDLVKVAYIVSPDEFWVHRKDDAGKLMEISTELKALSRAKKTTVKSPVVDEMYCSTFSDGLLYRCCVKEIFPNNTYSIVYIDYGNSTIIEKSALFFLNTNLMKYPPMAIKCSLANVKPVAGVNTWKQEDIELFSRLVLDKSLKAYVVNETSSSVDLQGPNGLSISDILMNSVNAHSRPEESSKKMQPNVKQYEEQESPLFEIPLVISRLQKESTVTLKIVNNESSSQRLWAWMVLEGLLEKYNEMEQSLQNVKTDITMIAECGDLAVAHSLQYKACYRCYVLNRSKNSIRVRYVDYGGEEEVRKLCSLPEEYKNVCSPTICIPSNQISIDVIAKLESCDNIQAKVKCIENDITEFSAVIDGKNLLFKGLPWYYDFLDSKKQKSTPADTIVSEEPKYVNVRMPKKPLTKELVNEVPAVLTQKPKDGKKYMAQKCLMERDLSLNCKTKVVVAWCVSGEEIYVHRFSDIKELHELQLELNKWCESCDQINCAPVEGDVVCAKFSLDGSWYRCQILEASSKDSFYVFFLDYGNKDSVELSDIRPMNEKFMYPRFTICVSLVDAPLELEVDDFEKLINREFELEVIKSTHVPKQVILYENGNCVFSSQTECSVPKKTDALVKAVLPQDADTDEREGKTCILKRNEVSELDLTEFRGADVCMTHVDDAKNLYIQLCSHQNNILKLQKDIFSYFCGQTAISSYSPSVDDLVGAYSNGHWYRGCVTEVKKAKCLVKLFDFGYHDEIDKSDIRPLPVEFLQPIYSICVMLDKVPPSELVKEVTDEFMKLVFKLEFTDTNSKPFKVRLYVDGECLNDQVQLPDDSSSSLNCTRVPERSSPIQSPPIYSESLKHLNLPLDSILDVVFVFNEGDTFYMQRIMDSETISIMHENLEQHCDKTSAIKRNLFENEIVSAKSAEDGKWYRANVKEIYNSEGHVKVWFFDYGNSEVVSKTNIRVLPSSFISDFPVFSIPVSIIKTSAVPQKTELYSQYTVKVGRDGDRVTVSIVDPRNLNIASAGVTESNPSTLKSKLVNSSKNTLRYGSLIQNSKIGVIFVHTEGDIYYLQKLDDTKSIFQLSSLLQEHCDEAEPVQAQLGDVVSACSPLDMKWYRAVVGKSEDPNKVTVFYVDYGNTETIDRINIRSLPKAADDFPVFCYPSTVRDRYGKPVSVSLSIPYTVIVCKSGDRVEVMIDVSLEENPFESLLDTVAAALVENNCKDDGSDINCKRGKKNVLPHNNMQEEIVMSGSNSSSQDYAIYSIEDTEYVPFEEGRNEIMVYCIKSIEEIFWAPFIAQNIMDNEFLVVELTEYCYKSNIVPYEPRLNEIVIAEYPSDNRWYRAAVVAVEEPSDYRVVFLDYGGDAVLTKKSIRKIEEKFLKLPLQAHIGVLAGFVYDDKDKDAINEEVLKIITSGWHGEVIISKDNEDALISCPVVTDHLIKKGLARLQ